jgi:hypothetical protein
MFYTFQQNNSGGRFERTEELDVYVVIEAESAEDANFRAEGLGIYFDGVDKDIDCPCCGDRWYPEDGEGDVVPSLYGTPIDEEEFKSNPYNRAFRAGIIIHYLDGTKKEIRLVKEGDA